MKLAQSVNRAVIALLLAREKPAATMGVAAHAALVAMTNHAIAVVIALLGAARITFAKSEEN